jgi:hypothetical protein
MTSLRAGCFVPQHDGDKRTHRLHCPSSEARTVLLDIDMRESLMLDRCFDDFLELSEVLGVGPLSKAASCMFRECDRIKWLYEIPFWSCLGHRTDRSCRTRLPSRECIVLVVEHDICHIQIPTTRMDKVPHPDPISIAITTNDDDREIWISELDPSSKRNRTTMKRLSCISIDILTRLP